MVPQLALRSLQGSGAAEEKHRWDFLTWICRICASCTEKHRSRMTKGERRKRNRNHPTQYCRFAVSISPEARVQMPVFKCNQQDFPRAPLAKFLDWFRVFFFFFCVETKESRKEKCVALLRVSDGPIAPPAGQEGPRPPGSSARSCSLLRHVRTYYTAEGSICSGRHLPECPPPTTPVPLS